MSLAKVQQRVWQGRLPLEIRLARSECRTYDVCDPYLVSCCAPSSTCPPELACCVLAHTHHHQAGHLWWQQLQQGARQRKPPSDSHAMDAFDRNGNK
jgi:hypothetical protein